MLTVRWDIIFWSLVTKCFNNRKTIFFRDIVKYIEESNVVMVAGWLLGKKFVNLLRSAAITNIWAIIVNPMKFVDRLEGSDTHSPPCFILEPASAWAAVNYWLITKPTRNCSRALNIQTPFPANFPIRVENSCGSTSVKNALGSESREPAALFMEVWLEWKSPGSCSRLIWFLGITGGWNWEICQKSLRSGRQSLHGSEDRWTPTSDGSFWGSRTSVGADVDGLVVAAGVWLAGLLS